MLTDSSSRKRTKKCVPELLVLREHGILNSYYFVQMKMMRSLIINPNSKLSCKYIYSGRDKVNYHNKKLYFYSKCLLTVFYDNTINGKLQEAFRVKLHPSHVKIKDIMVIEMPLYTMGPKWENIDWKSYIIVLTAKNWILRYDNHNGNLLQSVYLQGVNSKVKFNYLDWCDQNQEISVKTSLCSGSSDSDIITMLAVFKAYPFEFSCLFSVRHSVFGHDAKDAYLNSNALIVHHGSGSYAYLKIYDFQEIVSLCVKYRPSLGEFCSDISGVVGEFPFGLPVNLDITALPKLLFEVKTNGHFLEFGSRPYHYMTLSPGCQSKFCFSSLMKNELVGVLQFNSYSLEPETASFHPDESNRILVESPEALYVYEIKANPQNKSKIDKIFEFRSHLEEKRPSQKTTKYGRKVNPSEKFKNSSRFLDQTFLAMCYEDELDLMFCLFTGAEKSYVIHVFCNKTGKLLSDLDVGNACDEEGSEHSIEVDRDAIYLCYKTFKNYTKAVIFHLSNP